MTREFLKNIKSENRLDKIRLIMKNDDVIGGQPSDNENEFTSNTPLLDLACTMKYAVDEIEKNKTGADTDISAIKKSLNTKAEKSEVETVLQLKANTSTNVNAGNGLTGGGDLTTSRTLTLGTPSTISQNTKNSVTQSSHTHEIAKATTSQQGIVQLTNTIDTSQDKAITPFAVNELQKSIEQAITEATEVPVDKIFAFDSATPPAGYIARNGQAIDKNIMPKLYARYGANMPDDRDRVLRMAGELAGTAGSTQEDAIRNITGTVFSLTTLFNRSSIIEHSQTNGAFFASKTIKGSSSFSVTDNSSSQIYPLTIAMDASKLVPTASENRVKARIIIACNKIQ